MARVAVSLGIVAALSAAVLAAASPAVAAAAPTVTKVLPATGKTAGATRVTLTGTGFSGVKEVEFGSAKGTSVKIVSSKKLEVTSPAHKAGTIDVKVETSAGTSSAHTADHFTYVAPPAITKVAPSHGGTSGGTRVTITGTGFTSVQAVDFGTAAGSSLSVVKATELQVTAPPHTAGLIGIKVITSYGTSSGVSADHYGYLGSWTPSTPPVPGSLLVGELNGVSCLTITSCVAVGHAFDEHASVFYPTVDTIGSGGNAQVLPVPSDAKAGLGVALQSVSCTSATSCVAVGHDLSAANSYTLPLIETLSNGSWTALTPGFGNAANGADADTGLYSVACASATSCVAVGSDTALVHGSEIPLVETLSGGAWTASSAPRPTGTGNDVLRGVSCSSSTSCTAVGYDVNGGPIEETLAKGVWTGKKLPLPDKDTSGQLLSISCASATRCEAVGLTVPALHKTAPLVETLAGGVWTASVPRLPSGDTLGQLDAVSCASATTCMATGLDDIAVNAEADGNQFPLAEMLTDGVGTPANVTLPANGAVGQLFGVDCLSATACEAVGNYFNNSDNNISQLGDTFDGSA